MRLVSALLALVLVSCGAERPEEEPAGKALPESVSEDTAIVNARCPVMTEDPVDPAFVLEWRGQRVGFCCEDCPEVWEEMTDAEKDAALAEVTGK
jgi:hypothetical protein